MIHWKYYLKLVGWFLCIKSIQFGLVLLTPAQFDISTNPIKFTNFEIINQILNNFNHWDNVYFAQSFDKGPQFEHEWMFGPLWWVLVNQIPVYFGSKFIIATILANLLNLCSSFLIFKLTWIRSENIKKSYISAVLFLMSPMGLFSSIPYSENLSNFLIYSGLVIYYQYDSKLISSSLFGLSVMTRSNTIIMGYFFFHGFLFDRSISSLVGGIIMGASIIILNYIPYVHFCPDRKEWCESMIPSIFSYSQERYWNVGFLRYWTSNNLFNFIIASPMLYLLYKSIRQRSVDLKLQIVTLLHLVLCVFFIHVQIVLRISGFLPLQYWYIADLIIQNKQSGKNWILYLVIWIPIQTILFSSFLPPA